MNPVTAPNKIHTFHIFLLHIFSVCAAYCTNLSNNNTFSNIQFLRVNTWSGWISLLLTILDKKPPVRAWCHVKSCHPGLVFCFTVSSRSHFLWLIILWYAVARTLAPSEANKQSARGIFKRPAPLVFVCAAVIHSPNAHRSFTASLYIKLCIPVKREVGRDSERKGVRFLPQHSPGDLRHPVKLSWKGRGGRDTCQNADLDYIKGTLSV